MKHKFKVGDKVRRSIQNRYAQSLAIGYTDAIMTIEHIRADGSLKFVEDSSTIHFCPEYYSLVVSNTEPDLKSFPWIIYFRSKDEAVAIYEWIKARGYDFKFFAADYIKADGYFTNTYNGDVTPTTQLLCGKTFPVCGKTVRHEIVLDLEVKILGAKFPAIEPKKTEKQLEIESIRRDQEALAARLKKLEIV